MERRRGMPVAAVAAELHLVVATAAAVLACRASYSAGLAPRAGEVVSPEVLFLIAQFARGSSVPTVAAPEAAAAQEVQPPADTAVAAVAVEAAVAAVVAAEDLVEADSGADPIEPLLPAAGWAVHVVRQAEVQHHVAEHLPSFAEQAMMGIVAGTAGYRFAKHHKFEA